MTHYAISIGPGMFLLVLLGHALAVVAKGTSQSSVEAGGGGGGAGGAGTSACTNCFNMSLSWHSGSAATTLPMLDFSVRKLEGFVYTDGRTYAYADIVNFTDPYYPVSYSSEVSASPSALVLQGSQRRAARVSQCVCVCGLP